ncbi:MAG: hypothetical protein QOE86_1431 [Solirubrobacteraceae bacterium]|nr:hypothetical protein [Solirubrobacteraceae bacterium]
MLARSLASGVAGLAACGIVLALAWQSGGYFPDATLRAGCVAFAVLAVLLVARPPAWTVSGPSLLALAALGTFAAWTGLSSRWSAMPDVALEDFQRDLVYAGLFGLALVAAGSGRYSRHLAWAVLGSAVAICVAGLTSRLYPGWFGATAQPDALAGYRLAYPLAYWNAFGALGAMAVVLAAGHAADPRSHPALRGLASAGAVVAGTAAYLSFSRGGWLGFFAGATVLLVLAAHRVQLLLTLAIAGGALALALLRLRGYDGLTQAAGAGAGQAAEGRAFAPFLLGAALAAGALQAVVASVVVPEHARASLAHGARRVAPWAAGVVLLAGAGGYVAFRVQAEGHAQAQLDAADRWVSRQWREFMRPATFSASGAQRLTSARGTRSDLYRVAIDGFEAHPLRGDGSGSFQVRFAHDRKVDEKVRDAHSLYLETLGELGLPGILALLAFVGSIVWAGVAGRRRAGALGRGQAAAVLAAVSVWIGHAMVDWDWQVPALTGTALVLAAALFPTGRPGRVKRRSRSAAAGTVLGARSQSRP